MYKVLLVEDDYRMREIIAKYFVKEGFSVVECENGKEAIENFRKYDIDLVLLDLMIPIFDGYTVAREIRTSSDALIVMITARSQDEDKLKGFESGVDDYVTKPFSPKVLVARCKALLKRYKGEKETALIVAGDISINTITYEVFDAEDEILLSPKEFELLKYLIENKNNVLTREAILNKIWGYDYLGDTRTVDTHIKKLRRKLGKSKDRIKTIIRVGYKFEVK